MYYILLSNAAVCYMLLLPAAVCHMLLLQAAATTCCCCRFCYMFLLHDSDMLLLHARINRVTSDRAHLPSLCYCLSALTRFELLPIALDSKVLKLDVLQLEHVARDLTASAYIEICKLVGRHRAPETCKKTYQTLGMKKMTSHKRLDVS